MPKWSPFLLRLGMQGLGYFGLFFIAYGAISILTSSPWPPLEGIAHPLSSALTILATLLTSVSVYHASMNTPPERISKIATAPIVILMCGAALVSLIHHPLSPVIVNGFAMLGMAGAMMRIQPNPHYASNAYDAAFDKANHIAVVTEYIFTNHSEHIDDYLRILNEARAKTSSKGS